MTSVKTEIFFTESEKEKIRESVAAAERGTSGEIATMVVDHSDHYLEAEVVGAVLVAGLVAVIACVALQHITIWSYIPVVFLTFFPTRYLFAKFPRLKLSFVSTRRVERAVRDRAVRAFFEKGLYRTREEIGVLVFISHLERKVWILGDRGINAKISPHEWHILARELSAGIREGRACEALCAVINRSGAMLARHFPKSETDINELSDEILT